MQTKKLNGRETLPVRNFTRWIFTSVIYYLASALETHHALIDDDKKINKILM